jgi:hypothetical protein
MLGGHGADDVNSGGGGLEGGVGGLKGEAAMGGTGHVSGAEWSTMLHSEPGSEAPPRTDDPDYDGVAGTEEQPGLVVIHFSCTPAPPS